MKMSFLNRKKMRIEEKLANISKSIENRETLIKRIQNEINHLKEEKSRLNRGLNQCVKIINANKIRRNKTDVSILPFDDVFF